MIRESILVLAIILLSANFVFGYHPGSHTLPPPPAVDPVAYGEGQANPVLTWIMIIIGAGIAVSLIRYFLKIRKIKST